MKTSNTTQAIKQEAYRLGFVNVGMSKAGFLEEEAPQLEKWLNKNYHGQMAYMANHFDKRLDPRLLVDGAKSVISLSFNYYSENIQPKDSPKIAMYAYGEDYHDVLKNKLKELLAYINATIGEVNGRAFVDSAPVMDKAWAKKSGIGWMGKNTNLITKKEGSFYFLAELILDIDLEYDTPVVDHCGSCTKCIDACPTDALVAPYQIDASRCISYLTIELKEQIPSDFKGKMDNWMFGCDICQDVCPWNSHAKPHNESAFLPKEELKTMNRRDWEEITDEVFSKVFSKSAVKRTKLKGLIRNIAYLNDGLA